MDARVRHLLLRELDGELTPVERDELSRHRATAPRLGREAREARAWQRVEAGIREALDASPPLAVDRIAAEVARRAGRQRTRRPLVAAASLLVLGTMAAAQISETSGPIGPMHTSLVAPVPPRVAPPVEVDVERAGESGGLTRIEF